LAPVGRFIAAFGAVAEDTIVWTSHITGEALTGLVTLFGSGAECPVITIVITEAFDTLVVGLTAQLAWAWVEARQAPWAELPLDPVAKQTIVAWNLATALARIGVACCSGGTLHGCRETGPVVAGIGCAWVRVIAIAVATAGRAGIDGLVDAATGDAAVDGTGLVVLAVARCGGRRTDVHQGRTDARLTGRAWVAIVTLFVRCADGALRGAACQQEGYGQNSEACCGHFFSSFRARSLVPGSKKILRLLVELRVSGSTFLLATFHV
jgi:hypothetical protein